MPSPPILILTAVLPEAKAVAEALHIPPVPAHSLPLPCWKNASICLINAGIRGVGLPRVEAILDASPAGIVMAGLGGALDPGLKVGDVVVDGVELPGMISGKIFTSSKIVSMPEEKARLFSESRGIAVDMETDLVRQFAAKHAAKFLAARAISDSASQILDESFLSLIDAHGRPSAGRVGRFLLQHPLKIGALIRLGNDSKLALRNLGRAMKGIVDSGWPGQK